MELVFLKIDKIFKNPIGKLIEIPIGGARFGFRNNQIANDEPLVLQVDERGNFLNVNREIKCQLFVGQGSEGVPVKWLLSGLVTNESFEKKIKQRLGLNQISERELLEKEQEAQV